MRIPPAESRAVGRGAGPPLSTWRAGSVDPSGGRPRPLPVVRVRTGPRGPVREAQSAGSPWAIHNPCSPAPGEAGEQCAQHGRPMAARLLGPRAVSGLLHRMSELQELGADAAGIHAVVRTLRKEPGVRQKACAEAGKALGKNSSCSANSGRDFRRQRKQGRPRVAGCPDGPFDMPPAGRRGGGRT